MNLITKAEISLWFDESKQNFFTNGKEIVFQHHLAEPYKNIRIDDLLGLAALQEGNFAVPTVV